MKHLSVLILVLIGFRSVAQETKDWSFDFNYFKGNIVLHNTSILHLIDGHPGGIIFSWNQQTYGENIWEQRYNYPDYGLSVSYQDLKSNELGKNFGIYGHYNFYFLNRHLMFRIGQGLALTSNPYDKLSNHKNIAFGSRFMSSTFLMLNYKKERLLDRFGLQAGLTLIHYSNANVKAPNNSVNSITINLGINYNLSNPEKQYYFDLEDEFIPEKIKYNVILRSGINESDIIGSGQFPFYVISAYADKRLSNKSAIQLGTDVFLSNFLKELIRYRSVAFPGNSIDPDTDYKRVGIFVGHELFINKLSVIGQIGYYVYYPFDFEGRVYQRIGVKRYLGDKWFGAISLKTHAAKAEAIEFGMGIRL